MTTTVVTIWSRIVILNRPKVKIKVVQVVVAVETRMATVNRDGQMVNPAAVAATRMVGRATAVDELVADRIAAGQIMVDPTMADGAVGTAMVRVAANGLTLVSAAPDRVIPTTGWPTTIEPLQAVRTQLAQARSELLGQIIWHRTTPKRVQSGQRAQKDVQKCATIG